MLFNLRNEKYNTRRSQVKQTGQLNLPIIPFYEVYGRLNFRGSRKKCVARGDFGRFISGISLLTCDYPLLLVRWKGSSQAIAR